MNLAAVGSVFDALGSRLDLRVEAPFLADRRRQMDPAHAHCVAYVVRRLTAAGWTARREIEIGRGRSNGWIDVLGYRASDGLVLVVEVKTEIEDLGRIERAMAWYVSGAPAAARRLGWAPRVVVGVLIVLDTRATETRLRLNRDALVQTFPMRPEQLHGIVEHPGQITSALAPVVVAIDPTSRRAQWLMPTILHGRRGRAVHDDYADFMRSKRLGPRARV